MLLAISGAAKGQIAEIIDATCDGAGNPLFKAVGVAVDGADNVYVVGDDSEAGGSRYARGGRPRSMAASRYLSSA